MDYEVTIKGDFTKTISGLDFDTIQSFAKKLKDELGVQIMITQFSADYSMPSGSVVDNEKIKR